MSLHWVIDKRNTHHEKNTKKTRDRNTTSDGGDRGFWRSRRWGPGKLVIGTDIGSHVSSLSNLRKVTTTLWGTHHHYSQSVCPSLHEQSSLCAVMTDWFLEGVRVDVCDLRLLTHRFPTHMWGHLGLFVCFTLGHTPFPTFCPYDNTWRLSPSGVESPRVLVDDRKPSPKCSSCQRIRLLPRRERVSNILDYDKNVSSIESKNLKRHQIWTNKSEQHKTERDYIWFFSHRYQCVWSTYISTGPNLWIYIYRMVVTGCPLQPYVRELHFLPISIWIILPSFTDIVSTPYPVSSRVHRCFRGFHACNLSTMLGRSWWRIPIATVQVCVEVCVFRCTVALLRRVWSSVYLLRFFGVSTPWVWQIHIYHHGLLLTFLLV